MAACSSTTAAGLSYECPSPLVAPHAKAAWLPHNTAAHGLRYRDVEGRGNVQHVQELLGHSNLTTTHIYTRIVPVNLQKVRAATDPSERRKKLDIPDFECRAFRDKKFYARLFQQP